MSENIQSNPGKQLERTVDGVTWLRIPVKTHLITREHDIVDVARQYAAPLLREGDILFLSEKAVACTQGRAYPMEDIKPRKLAVTLSHHVTKTPHGIGLGIPETMEMALRECGTLRILLAAACSVVGKLLGRKGWFYIVAGTKAGPGQSPQGGPPAGRGPGLRHGHRGHQRPGGQHPGLLPQDALHPPAGADFGGQPPGPGRRIHPHGHHPQGLTPFALPARRPETDAGRFFVPAFPRQPARRAPFPFHFICSFVSFFLT